MKHSITLATYYKLYSLLHNMKAIRLAAPLVVLALIILSFMISHSTSESDRIRRIKNTVNLIFNLSSLLQEYHTFFGCYPCQTELVELADNALACMATQLAQWDAHRLLQAVSRRGQLAAWDVASQAFIETNGRTFDYHSKQIYILDAWGRPLVYRIGDGTGRAEQHHTVSFLIYSKGPNGVDDTANGRMGDDIGNW